MTARSLGRLPPGGSPIPGAALLRALRERDPARSLRAQLAAQLGVERVTLHASGREALRTAFAWAAKRTGREEVVVPAYTCFSVPAAAVAAGLRVRLVDVTPRGQVDPASLSALPLERAAALLVSNLFGVPDPTAPLRHVLRGAGVLLVDDAAQALGAQSRDGCVGARGEVGVLSFGRGKPLSALGGGALAWPDASDVAPERPAPAPRPVLALCRALGFDAALHPWAFRLLSTLPGLGIGETIYDPDFPRGGIDGASLSVAASLAAGCRLGGEARAGRALALAARLKEKTRFAPLVPEEGDCGVFPRLGVLAPSRAPRDEAVVRLRHLGASAMYPSSLDAIERLRPHLAGDAACPGAAEFAGRVLTLPTHAAFARAGYDEVVRILQDLA